MPAQLSKLHVRFIQTQKGFFLQREKNTKNDKFPLEQLYIKNSSSFYYANQSEALQDNASVSLTFKEPNDYLNHLRCEVNIQVIEQGSDEHEEALLFFHIDASTIKQVLLLTVEAIDAK